MDNKIITELQDMRYLEWGKIRNSSGTAGSFLKSYDNYNEKKRYYKLSNYNATDGITGYECINEIIADRLTTVLGIPHLVYNLIHATIEVDGCNYETYLCMSHDFKEPGESKIALDAYYQMERLSEKESMLDFCIRNGWEEYIYQMLILDFLILNRDRHGANIEVLRNSKTKSVRLAPLFDHGLSFVCSCTSANELGEFINMKDLPVQCCVGSNSAYKNLFLIPKDKIPKVNHLEENDREILMYGLEGILPKPWQDKIWEMLWERWQAFESFCNQK